jgi:hypothetical protein
MRSFPPSSTIHKLPHHPESYFMFSFAFCAVSAFAAVSFEGLTFGAVGRLIPDTLLLTLASADFFVFWWSLSKDQLSSSSAPLSLSVSLQLIFHSYFTDSALVILLFWIIFSRLESSFTSFAEALAVLSGLDSVVACSVVVCPGAVCSVVVCSLGVCSVVTSSVAGVMVGAGSSCVSFSVIEWSVNVAGFVGISSAKGERIG